MSRPWVQQIVLVAEVFAKGGDEVDDLLRRQATQVEIPAELAQAGSDLFVLKQERLGVGWLLLTESRKDVDLLVIAVMDELVLERPLGDTEGNRIVTRRLSHNRLKLTFEVFVLLAENSSDRFFGPFWRCAARIVVQARSRCLGHT